MFKPKGVLLCCASLMLPAMALQSAATPSLATLHTGVCEVGSACRRCIERYELKVWREGNQVKMSGISAEGKPMLESLLDCQFQGSSWSCSTGQHRLEFQGSNLRLTPATHSRTSGYEWCDLGE